MGLYTPVMGVEIHRDPNAWGDVKTFLAHEFPEIYLALRRAKNELLLSLLPPSVETKTAGNVQFLISFHGLKERAIACGPAFEEKFIEEMLNSIKPGDAIWDIGAAIGTHAIPAAIKTGVKGRVYAFEPDDTCCKTLERNLRLNKVPNVTILPVALWDKDASLTVHTSNRNGSAARVTENEQESAGKFEHHFPVDGRAAQSLVADGTAQRPDVIKIDVEGGGEHVLEGMDSLRPRDIFMEVHPKLGENREKITGLLEARGYQLVSAILRGGEIHLHFSKSEF